MKIKNFLFLFLILIAVNANAQYENFENTKPSNNTSQSRSDWFWEHIVFGGNIGLSVGSVTAIEVNPCIGYRFNRYLNAGLIVTYEYFRDSYNDYTNSVYGGGLYAEGYPFDFLTIHAEAQYLNFKNYDGYYSRDVERVWDMPILIGAGYRKRISDYICVNLMLLFNINNTSALRYNVYNSNPIVKINVMF